MATLAPSLAALRAEINARWPRRDTGSDGWIGDPAHQDRPSDHNPGARDLVHALDIDEDLDGVDDVAGAELRWLVDHLVATRDPRVAYLIYEGQIWRSYDKPGLPAWTPEPYRGANPHDRHLHVSIHSTPTAEQNTSRWLPQEDDMTEAEMIAAATKGALAALDSKARRVRGISSYEQLLGLLLGYAREDDVDEAAIAAGVLAKLTPEAIAAAIPTAQAQAVADELAARLVS